MNHFDWVEEFHYTSDDANVWDEPREFTSVGLKLLLGRIEQVQPIILILVIVVEDCRPEEMNDDVPP